MFGARNDHSFAGKSKKLVYAIILSPGLARFFKIFLFFFGEPITEQFCKRFANKDYIFGNRVGIMTLDKESVVYS